MAAQSKGKFLETSTATQSNIVAQNSDVQFLANNAMDEQKYLGEWCTATESWSCQKECVGLGKGNALPAYHMF